MLLSQDGAVNSKTVAYASAAAPSNSCVAYGRERSSTLCCTARRPKRGRLRLAGRRSEAMTCAERRREFLRLPPPLVPRE